MTKYKPILPADVYVSGAQWLAIREDRENGIPHPEIAVTNIGFSASIAGIIRLTGNNFMDLFASLVEEGCGHSAKGMARTMGIKPLLLSAAIEAMSGLSAHTWAMDYLHLSACDKLRNGDREITSLAGRLGFGSVSAFSHFFYRRERCYPSQFKEVDYKRTQRRLAKATAPSPA
jgi:AraC-like DNA-binding protein